MKISDLTDIRVIPPMIVVSDGGRVRGKIAHIVDRTGEFCSHPRYNRHYEIMRCKRVMRYTWHLEQKQLARHKLCHRCGTHEDFQKAIEERIEITRIFDEENARTRELAHAELKAEAARNLAAFGKLSNGQGLPVKLGCCNASL